MTVNVYDIRTKDKFCQKRLETIHGVKMYDDDEEFYLNNCYGSYSAKCNTSGTSRAWQKQTKRKKESKESGQCKRKTNSWLERPVMTKQRTLTVKCFAILILTYLMVHVLLRS